VNENTTCDNFLGGRVTIVQPASGYRAAIDPVLLAACCPAKPGEQILDAGCGVGTAALCVIARTGCRSVGIEVQDHMVVLALKNAGENKPAFEPVQGSILAPPTVVKQASFDHAICNPPYLREGYGTGIPNPADYESEAPLADWVDFCCRRTRDQGSVVFIHRADRLDELLALMSARLGALAVLPLWPSAGSEAKRVIVGGIKGRRTPLRLLPGLVLHQADGAYTDEADAVLRDAQPIQLWQ
jgi:tRNA1(Val) A37 N6-methylase TrmN6